MLLFNNMEPQQNEVESVISPLKKVTPVLKYLAMGLFIILPFLGGWIGYNFAPVKIIEVERVVEAEKADTNWASSSAVAEDVNVPKMFPAISEECKDITSNSDQYYAIYANDLTLGQKHRCDYERRTGRTYELSSTTIRVVDWDLAQAQDQNLLEPREYKNVNLSKDLEIHTQLPHLIALSTTTNELILTSHCFVAKACSFGGLYKFDLRTNTLSRMETSEYFNITSRASRVSPDRTKIISSDENYEGSAPNSLYLVDLKTDTYKILDTIDPSTGEGTFCTGGMNGCSDISLVWLPENKIEVQIFKLGDKRESRIYPLE